MGLKLVWRSILILCTLWFLRESTNSMDIWNKYFVNSPILRIACILVSWKESSDAHAFVLSSFVLKEPSLAFNLFHIIKKWQKCLLWIACLLSKMPIIQRIGMREGGRLLPLKSVHFKNTVARSSVYSKLWSFSIIHQLTLIWFQLVYYWKWS